MRKFKCFIDCDKEEKCLRDMLQKGYELESVSFGFKFHSIKQENSKIRIDYRSFKNNGKNNEEDIFSDSMSKAGKYKRLSTMRMTSAACLFMLSSSIIFGNNPIFKSILLNPPKSLYFTPGLW